MAGPSSGSLLRQFLRLVEFRHARESDRELLRRYAAGRDEEAFAAVVARHGPMVLALGRRLLGNAHDAEDVFQATFLVLARKAARVRWRASVGTWLYEVAHRLAREAKADAARRQFHERRAEVRQAADPFGEVSLREAGAVLDEELAGLPERLRAPLVLCCLEGLTRDEAARQLGWTVRTLKDRLARGRERLRRRLERRGFTLPAALAAALVAEGVAPAAVPVALVQATVQAAAVVAAGGVLAAGMVSERVTSLSYGVLQTMFLTQLKLVAAATLAVAAIAGGAGVLTYRAAPGAAADGPKQTPVKGPAGEVRQGNRTPPKGTDKPPSYENDFRAAADDKKAKEEKKPSPGNETAPPAEAVAEQPKEISAARYRELRDKLSRPIDINRPIEANTSLSLAMDFLSDRYDLTILINPVGFPEEVDGKSIEKQPIQLPRMRGIPLGDVLRWLVEQVNGAYVIRSYYIEITTPERINPGAWTKEGFDRRKVPTVGATFQQRPLGEALSEIVHLTGINVVLDTNHLSAEQAKTVITAQFDNVPIDSAVRVVADMADLRPVALDGVLYVTTRERAQALEQDRVRQPVKKPEAQKKEEKSPARP
jgi:RNA polymerase sigma factor (sigma-70 family)